MQRFLLPRITRSALARRALKEHQVAQLRRLTASLAELRTTQRETFAVLPAPAPAHRAPEPAEFAEKQSLAEVNADEVAKGGVVPPYTLLRCAIADLVARDARKPTGEEVLALLDTRFGCLAREEGAEYRVRVVC